MENPQNNQVCRKHKANSPTLNLNVNSRPVLLRLCTVMIVGSLYGLFQIDSIREKQQWGKKKKKNILRFVKQQLLEMQCQSGPGLGLRLGQQLWIHTRLEIIHFSANSNNFFAVHTINEKNGAWRVIWTGSCLRKARRGPLCLYCGPAGRKPQPQTGQYGCLQTYKKYSATLTRTQRPA